jgi:hypothetical protein
MRTIYKYPVQIEDEQTIEIPLLSKVLTVQIQHGKPYIWVAVDTDSKVVPFKFKLYGTGHPITNDSNYSTYIGTFQLCSGDLVFHLYLIG